jgi:cytochrome c-type biogenesis protein CcmF
VNGAGNALLAAAVVASLAGLLLPLLGRAWGRPVLVRAGMWALYAVLLLVVADVLVLLGGFLTRDFGNLYVYEHSSRALSWVYTVSALWAGNSGSLLLWLLLMAVFAVIAARGGRKRDVGSVSYLVPVLSLMNLFFSLLVLFAPACNPFVANHVATAAADGLGLNPMLQNPGMVIHPVTLYLGYVAMAVPFALMVAGLANRSPLAGWIAGVRRWALIGWLFLTIGNVVGAWWAYVTLGWGGYWAWDPVENASLIPWLTATALLHAVLMAQRRQRQQIWMVSLVSATFLLTIFGTFLTRTGVATSVHAFTEPGLIAWFVIFMVVMLALAVTLIVVRRAALRGPDGKPPSFFGESSNIFYTVVLLSVLTFLILWGVIFPPIAQSLYGGEFLLGTGFFDAVAAPLGLLLLLMMVVCSLVSSSRGSRRILTVGACVAGGVGLVVLVVLLVAGVRKGYPVAAFALTGAAVASVAMMLARGWRVRRRYGALLVHLGLLTLVIGLAGSWSFKDSVERELALGESLSLGKVEVVYQDLDVQPAGATGKEVTRATLGLSLDGDGAGELVPTLEYYPANDQTWTRVARRTSAAGDVYVSLLGVGADGETIDLKLEYHPLIVWLWIGGGIMSLGAIVALWSVRRRPRGAPLDAAGSPATTDASTADG